MRTTVIALVAALLLVGAAAPAIAQNDTTDLNETFDNDSDDDFENETEEEENETEEDELENETEENETEEFENETEEYENETERDQDRTQNRSVNPQFDARLMTAITTVEALVQMAPSEDAEEGLQDALDELKEVQEETDTRSLPDEERERERDQEQELNRTNASEQAEEPGPPGDRGPSENSNRPGFVSNMLSSIFG